MILDGFGEGKNYQGNAIKKAKTPNIDALKKVYPWTILQASGEAVGLPKGTQGGSEVGHLTIGAGRVIFQTLEEINHSIKDRTFFNKKPFLHALNRLKKNPGSALHLLGMISDQGVHSDLHHLFALLELAKKHKVKKLFIHAITDGRDVAERTAAHFIAEINKKIKKLGMGKNSPTEACIATIIGRFYAMDRDHNWERTEKAYKLYVLGKGIVESDPLAAVKNAYQRGIPTDYYIDPIILDEHGIIKDKDSVIFWNFRTDRTRQITQCFTGEAKIGFKPQKIVRPFFVCFGDYSTAAPVVFPAPPVKNNLGSVIAQKKLRQLRMAETEKYAHVTYFLNSQIQKPFRGEKRILIDSPKVASYAEKPEMSAFAIQQKVIAEMEKDQYSLIIQNFANPDLVGHSGDLKATIRAVEVVDKCIGAIVKKALSKGYTVVLTADHGNAEYMIYENSGQPCPSHTTNPVICLIIGPKYRQAKLAKGQGLKDIAPTILEIMKIPKPKEMSGQSLIRNP